MDMPRVDRVTLILEDDDLTVEEAVAFGLQVQDFADALTILQLQMELNRRTAEPLLSVRDAVEAYLRRTLGEGG